MPVIVIGADTSIGRATVDALLPGAAELRAFITDPEEIEPLKMRGVKVAVGDISDGSHVGGAAMRAFCAVLVPEAATDDRERSFAASPDAVVAAWAEGLRDAGVHRAIWVDNAMVAGAAEVLASAVTELAVVEAAGRPPADIAAEIAHLEAQRTL
jgi:nucleoside-diphosphate-sugar epimerase